LHWWAHAIGHHFWFLHDLFDGELADNAAQVALHNEADQAFALLGPLGEKLFSCGADGNWIGLHFDLRDRFHSDGHALLGVETLLRSYVEGHQLERQLPASLHHGPDDGAAAFYDAGFRACTVNDQRFMRANFSVHLGQGDHDQEHSQHSKTSNHWNDWESEHKNLPFVSHFGGLLSRASVRENFLQL
jgi:hypothetical protein